MESKFFVIYITQNTIIGTRRNAEGQIIPEQCAVAWFTAAGKPSDSPATSLPARQVSIRAERHRWYFLSFIVYQVECANLEISPAALL